MTVCNMSIEAGARAGMIAPDETTFAYLQGRPRAPEGRRHWDAAVARWRTLASDPGAAFDASVDIDAATARTHDHLRHESRHGAADQRVHPAQQPSDAGLRQGARVHGISRAATRMLGKPINVVFIGSCTNGRLEDLQSRRAHPQGTQGRGRRASADRAGLPAGQARGRGARARGHLQGRRRRLARVGLLHVHRHERRSRSPAASTPSAPATAISRAARASGARTLLASPFTAAASAVRGRITDPRDAARDGTDQRRSRSQDRRDAVREHRHRSDHSGALPDHHDQGRPGQAVVRATGAICADGPPNPDFILNQPEARGLPRCWWPAATSAAAPRASTRRGRFSTTASAPSSAPKSRTSSAATP